MQTRPKKDIFILKTYTAIVANILPSIPSSHTEALKNPLWFKIMSDEINALRKNKT